jgi:hypothetical protein
VQCRRHRDTEHADPPAARRNRAANMLQLQERAMPAIVGYSARGPLILRGDVQHIGRGQGPLLQEPARPEGRMKPHV